jgi:hypothetical protein
MDSRCCVCCAVVARLAGLEQGRPRADLEKCFHDNAYQREEYSKNHFFGSLCNPGLTGAGGATNRPQARRRGTSTVIDIGVPGSAGESPAPIVGGNGAECL